MSTADKMFLLPFEVHVYDTINGFVTGWWSRKMRAIQNVILDEQRSELCLLGWDMSKNYETVLMYVVISHDYKLA